MADSVICVDLSNYQAGFNLQTFKDGGGLGVILKATEDTSIKDHSYPIFSLLPFPALRGHAGPGGILSQRGQSQAIGACRRRP